ncbi:ARMT1-like domain-containing protein [Halosquirtibacter xylanolyticus]|uniref:damage-control phosphatase ARMT1 family protein n=1 Tax=Halosquirtibacter xylanolyticus TaxID=3374599 RepID=UPI00374969A5|nr:ARMT1-like domain-containing protein [Prolixibacteraceae bacterium]
MEKSCQKCHIRSVEKLIQKFSLEPARAARLRQQAKAYLDITTDIPNPIRAQYIHRLSREILQNRDPFDHVKRSANELLMAQYDHWFNYIRQSEEPLFTASKLAIIGNIIDYGAHRAQDDIIALIEPFLSRKVVTNQIDSFVKSIDRAKDILYLGDNAGEIFFDKLLIELIGPEKVTYVTRGEPVINDVTKEDAETIGITSLCKTLDNGSDAPSTVLSDCSDAFLEHYYASDMIISKGQGNFEGLMNEKHTNTFFLLIAKCIPIADMLNVHVDDMVLKKYEKHEFV